MDAKIHLEVWAGALGVPILRKELDVAKLNSKLQAEVKQLISTSDVLNLPERPMPPPQLRDANQTKIVFETAGSKQTVRIADPDVSPPLRTLIEFLKAHGS